VVTCALVRVAGNGLLDVPVDVSDRLCHAGCAQAGALLVGTSMVSPRFGQGWPSRDPDTSVFMRTRIVLPLAVSWR
jgi:hypothetical protein